MKSNNCASGSYCPNPSKYEVKLYRKLKDMGIESRLKYWDGIKTIDIAILWAKLFVQIVDDYTIHDNLLYKADFFEDDQPENELIQTLKVDFKEIKDDTNRVASYIARIAKTRYKQIQLS